MAAETQQRYAEITTTGAASVKISSHVKTGYVNIITSWDSIISAVIDPISYEITPSSCAFQVINDVPVGGETKFSLISGLVFGAIEIYQNSVKIFKGSVDHLSNIGRAFCTVHCVSDDVDLSKKFAHDIVDIDIYSSADPDDVGKMLPQVYGSVKRVPFMGVDTGAISTLLTDIVSGAASIELSDARSEERRVGKEC